MYKVYLVDDDALILDELLTSVSWLDNGFIVCGHSNSPLTAIDEVLILRPDLVIADLKMEPFDGIELMHRLKEQAFSCHFLMISAYGSFENSRRFFVEGGFDYILKPIDIQEIELVLNRLYRKLSENTAENLSLKGCNPAFTELMAHLEQNYHQKHTLESLGKQFGLSPNYICNLFSKHCDTTLVHHLTKLRMEAARKQIEENTDALKVIASKCGFNDYYYFCRVFKDYFGVSPGKFGNKGNNLE